MSNNILSHKSDYICYVLALILSVYSPIFAISIIFLLSKYSLENEKTGTKEILTAFLLSLAIAQITGSRAFFYHFNDDFSNIYWSQFLEIRSNGFSAVFDNAAKTYTTEYLFYLWFFILSKFNFIDSPGKVIFMTTFVFMFIYFFQLIRYTKLYFPSNKRLPFLSLVISLSSFGIISQLTRQSLSAYVFAIIILNLVIISKKRILSYTIISFFLHHSTLYNILLIYIAKVRLKKFFLALSLVATLALIFIEPLVNLLMNSVRLEFYTLSKYSEDSFQYNYLFLNRALILLGILFFSLFQKQFRIKNRLILSITGISLFVYFLTINIPLLAVRLNFITFYILFPVILGAFLSKLFKPKFFSLMGITAIFLFILRSIIIAERGTTVLWYNYPPISLQPFNYLLYEI